MLLMSAVVKRPISVAVHGARGDNNTFQNWKGPGVLKSKCYPRPQSPRPRP